MELIPCGTKVVTTIGNVEAIITGITIRFETVKYEISYFTNSEYKSEWVHACEFTCSDVPRNKIGFIQ